MDGYGSSAPCFHAFNVLIAVFVLWMLATNHSVLETLAHSFVR